VVVDSLNTKWLYSSGAVEEVLVGDDPVGVVCSQEEEMVSHSLTHSLTY
jgi:hypothetical protein